jgi:hypothetical protein
MTSHSWGDGFDFQRLEEAGRYLTKAYAELSGRRMFWKEKYGTIRYECTFLWVETAQELIWFNNAARDTISHFPDMAGEIADDLTWFFPDEMEEFNQFYEGVAFLHTVLNKDKHYDSSET